MKCDRKWGESGTLRQRVTVRLGKEQRVLRKSARHWLMDAMHWVVLPAIVISLWRGVNGSELHEDDE